MSEDKRVALIGIIVDNQEADDSSIDRLNSILHEYRDYIIGRMGIPYSEKNIGIISIAIDAKGDTISAISGKIGALKGVNTKTLYSKQ